MLFNSIKFLIFFPIVFLGNYFIKNKYRCILLLIASYYFYMSWNPKLIFLIFGTTIISYVCSLQIDKSDKDNIKKIYLYFGILSSLLILFFYKYFNFFSESVVEFLRFISIPVNSITLDLILPVGISFYTFQTLSYIIDVYKGKIKAEKNLCIYSLYVSFFPQLVAGPIERPENLIPQFKANKKIGYDDIVIGLRIACWGFFKKIVIADTLSIYVNNVYNNVYDFSGSVLILATIMFSIQVYCDFSGYSDIAVGTAKMLGYDLINNFKSPYFSKSIKEFWRRWHISLSSWFTDYIYIPLGGNRVKVSRYYLNILITFLISGLWHGANWTFIVWGLLHGLYMVLESATREVRKKMYKLLHINNNIAIGVIKIIIVFCLVCFAWIFFRANNINDAFYVIQNMFDGISQPFVYLNNSFVEIGLDLEKSTPIFISIFTLFLFDYLNMKENILIKISHYNIILRWAIYYLVVWAILFCGTYTESGFIYFQF